MQSPEHPLREQKFTPSFVERERHNPCTFAHSCPKRRSSNFRLKWIALVLSAALPSLLMPDSMAAAENRQSKSGIKDVEATPIIAIRIEIHADDQPISIPYCGRSGEDYVSCLGEAYLEISRDGKWAPARIRKGLLVTLGVDSNEVQEHLLIQPGKTNYFTFHVDNELFGIQKGELLRMRMNTWKSADSIGNRDAQIVIISPVFRCP
jgi:hypothetical protein